MTALFRKISSNVDGRIPASQLSLVVYPIIYKVLAPSQVVFSLDFWTINSITCSLLVEGTFGECHHRPMSQVNG